MMKVDDLITWAKLNAYGRSTTIPNGWIRAEDLQSLVYKIVEKEPLKYEPFNKGCDTE